MGCAMPLSATVRGSLERYGRVLASSVGRVTRILPSAAEMVAKMLFRVALAG
jgi:hypothetical protein